MSGLRAIFGGMLMTRTAPMPETEIDRTSQPEPEQGWTRDAHGQIVSNGCACVWKAGIGWVKAGCKVHGRAAVKR